jgi:hypothetical protein
LVPATIVDLGGGDPERLGDAQLERRDGSGLEGVGCTPQESRLVDPVLLDDGAAQLESVDLAARVVPADVGQDPPPRTQGDETP